MSELFRHFAHKVAQAVGTPLAFIAATTSVVVWALLGPTFGFSEDWQLVINTGTTIVTFLMVFVIQNSQNRDSASVQLKLGELLRAIDAARTEMVSLEDLPDEELVRLHTEFARIASQNPSQLKSGDTPATIAANDAIGLRPS
jgi:low affinity Fe/Cu permease